MSDFKLHKIYQPSDSASVADIVFIHGLGGDPYSTWKKDDHFWPEWLAEDFPSVSIWTLEHPSAIFASMLTGGGMSFAERARAIEDYLDAKNIGTYKPVVFVTHSLGGILAKAALRKSSDLAAGDNSTLLKSTAGVVFMATPHKGSSFANFAKVPMAPISDVAKELQKNSSHLDDLNEWYRNHSISNEVKTGAYYEKDKYLNKFQVVTKDSADPGVHLCNPIPVDSDHFDICKFTDRENPIFLSIVKFIDRCIGHHIASYEDYDDYYITQIDGDRKSLHDKLDDGERLHEYNKAEKAKQRISKRLSKFALLPSSNREQIKFVRDVLTRFELAVSPMIKSGETEKDVNKEILNEVIDPIVKINSSFFGEKASTSDILDTIYFLTGTCHIKWSKD